METIKGIFAIILLAAVYVIVKWLIVHIIIPGIKVFTVIGKVIAAAGVAVGAYFAIRSYIRAIQKNINPYDYYVDNSSDKQEFAKRRSYFFGPGFLQLKNTVRDAWGGIINSVKMVFAVRSVISDWADIPILHAITLIFSWIFVICAVATVGILGGAITCVLSVLHASVMLVVMIVIYILFSITWLVDRIYLQIHSIKAVCPYCERRYVIPMFQCPKCGNIHTKLIPGPYGIWHRECTCGEILPTTFLLGRSKLKSFCPECSHELAASDAQQFSISLVGGTSSGKTTLLTSFYHGLFSRIDSNVDIDYDIPDLHADMFDNLESWFKGAYLGATPVSETAEMYSVLLSSDSLEIRKQFSIYDISGEAFDDPKMETMLPLYQLRDSDGTVLVIDPLSSSELRERVASEGGNVSDYSSVDNAQVITNYVTYLNTVLTNKGLGKRNNKPVAVVITKVDIPLIASEISYAAINNKFQAEQGRFVSFSNARDAICEEFLKDNGLYDVVNALTVNCNNVHYFPVSAIGHEQDGTLFRPENVMEPFSWILWEADPVLAKLIDLKNPIS